MFTMYDSTTPEVIPESPHAVLAYINGDFANYDYCKKRFPHARILRCSVVGMVAADLYDIEKGDYEAAQVPELYKIAKDAGIWRPGFYAQLSGVMPEVKAELNKVAGITRQDVRLHVAYYNGTPDLPEGYDAHQFTNHALGRNLDESICADNFFQPVKPTEVEVPIEEWHAEISVNTRTREWDVKPLSKQRAGNAS